MTTKNPRNRIKGYLATITQLAIAGLLAISTAFAQGSATPDKQTVADAWVYLLGRAVVIRQEQIDLKEPGVKYNAIKYNPVGSADFANPNLDVAYMEAWIAVDDRTAVLLNVPEIKGRYYTAQILDEWGEVITNINERNYPSHPHGAFAFVAPGSRSRRRLMRCGSSCTPARPRCSRASSSKTIVTARWHCRNVSR